MFSSKKMFRLAFNTHLLDTNEVVLKKDMLDPDKTKHKAQFPPTFKITLFFDHKELDPTTEESIQQLKGIEVIKQVLIKRKNENISELDTQVLAFGDPDFDDRDEVMVHHEGEKSDESDEGSNSGDEC